MLRVAFFGSDGEFSCRALAAVAARHCVATIIAPPTARGALRGLWRSLRGRESFSLDRLARRHTAPVRRVPSGGAAEAAAALADARADVICLAGYPWLLSSAVFAQPRLGAINLHGSLLPRHRGILPLFWIYYHDDRDTGVTVHRVTDRADAGAILGQDAFSLPRGLPVDRLNTLNAERGGPLLATTLDALESGSAIERPQDERLATPAPRITRGASMVDFAHWGAERVWHFLAGLNPRFQEPLVDTSGRSVGYREVRGFTLGSQDRPPGRVERAAGRLTLHCRDGSVELW